MSGDMMSFPNNWWTFVQQYQFADKDEVYTNGSMLIPSFRVRQMVEHYFGGEVGKTSRHAELFGTPERAAWTMITARGVCESGPCSAGCPFNGAPVCPSNFEPRYYDTLLEWLRGEGDVIDEPDTIRNELADGGLIADVLAPVCVEEKERRAFERGRVHERFAQQIFKEAGMRGDAE